MSAAEEQWTIGRLLKWTTDFLAARGADSPRLDAEVLLAHALGCRRIELYTRFDELPDDPRRAAFRELVRQRAGGMPVAYLVGHREFYSLSFRVTPDVLIPRPETELLLVRLLDLAKQQQSSRSGSRETSDAPPETSAESLQIADIGCGSGILAICAARSLPGARVTAIDISPAALAVARENAASLGVTKQIEFVESDLFAAIESSRRFDFVASNPPYIRSDEMAGLMVDVRKFEPRMALEAGPRGTEVIERLIPHAAQRLKPGGWLLVEISPTIEPAVRELLASDPAFEPPASIKDLAGQFRIVQARRRP
ncbi:MAG TPA: peptide chain release factor N(5)-glutamine methyltransferase [Pirellulales bacterium]|jgi:release factor glutamine methyltransferase|nr:peptide chain release factor N(5)-glutamine methyltransferase [Pirellulales bacterium]